MLDLGIKKVYILLIIDFLDIFNIFKSICIQKFILSYTLTVNKGTTLHAVAAST